ncbi:Uncharacterised protein [Mycobacteroides abscessus subsp. abscessus]|nr:Uncharacterised protein [Mycobacteroides abscessus subsp. abscessus]
MCQRFLPSFSWRSLTFFWSVLLVHSSHHAVPCVSESRCAINSRAEFSKQKKARWASKDSSAAVRMVSEKSSSGITRWIASGSDAALTAKPDASSSFSAVSMF